MSTFTNASSVGKVSLPTIDKIEENWTSPEEIINFLRGKKLNIIESHFKVLHVLKDGKWEPLLRKLSVVTYEELKYHQLQDFVRTDIKEFKSEIEIQISTALCSTIDQEFLVSRSENMLHYLIDSLIRIPNTIFRHLGGKLPLEIDKDRGLRINNIKF
ncbi:crinkler family protein [Gigaspora margarita]|uniref:Crinkler family protein n=1 Tax=Gigaspora margarita TaxID=4874 RepID=A0A8H3WZR6_GIGMA|nr:crinkler family protein [Gigaspora margarita]